MDYLKRNFRRKIPALENGDTLTSCNLLQPVPRTLFAGTEDITVVKGNQVNCTFPPEVTVVKGNQTQKDFCCHLHPEWNLQDEPDYEDITCNPDLDDCRHTTDISEIKIDGEVLNTVYTHEDIIL